MDSNAAVETEGRDVIKFITRGFGWSMLAVFVVWMTNNFGNISLGWPGVASLFSDNASVFSFAQLALYGALIAVALYWVWKTEHISLRQDAATISNINAYLVRWAFFAVLFVGLADMVVSFLRVEGLLESVVGTQTTSDLGRSAYRGPYVHVPMIALGAIVAVRARTLGFHWLALLIVAAELLIVITRFIFSYEQAFMGDLVRFWYAALFLFSSAYTLLEDGHVRVDIFYAGMKNKTKGFVNALGTILLGMSLSWTIIILGLGGKSASIYGPVSNFEVSQSGFGMYVKYLMASFLAIFAITMLVQFVSYLLESVADYRQEPGSRLAEAETETLPLKMGAE